MNMFESVTISRYITIYNSTDSIIVWSESDVVDNTTC